MEDFKEQFLKEFGVAVTDAHGKPYMNANERKTWFKVGGMVDGADELIAMLEKQGDRRGLQEARTVMTLLKKMFGRRVAAIDPSQIPRVIGEWKTSKLILRTDHVHIPITSDMTDGVDGMAEIPLDWYRELICDALEVSCRQCRLKGDLVQMCKRRQMFLNTDVPMANEDCEVGRCPYQA